jgi:hypothetical protein
VLKKIVQSSVSELRWLLENFGVSVSIPTPLLSDSTGTISIARDPVKHELTKHVSVDAHFMRSQVQDGVVVRFLHEGSDSRSSSVLPLQTQCC